MPQEPYQDVILKAFPETVGIARQTKLSEALMSVENANSFAHKQILLLENFLMRVLGIHSIFDDNEETKADAPEGELNQLKELCGQLEENLSKLAKLTAKLDEV